MEESKIKICSDCKQEKDISLFVYDKSRNRYLSVCKPCTSIRTQKHKKKNPKKWKDYSKDTNQRRAKFIQELKIEGCKKCGDKRYYVIDFHHIDPSKKNFSISDVSVKLIKEEVKKCILLCSNCHREFHFLEKTNNITIEQYLKQ